MSVDTATGAGVAEHTRVSEGRVGAFLETPDEVSEDFAASRPLLDQSRAVSCGWAGLPQSFQEETGR